MNSWMVKIVSAIDWCEAKIVKLRRKFQGPCADTCRGEVCNYWKGHSGNHRSDAMTWTKLG